MSHGNARFTARDQFGVSDCSNQILSHFGLTDQTSPKSVAQRRGKKVADLLKRGGATDTVAEADAAAVTE